MILVCGEALIDFFPAGHPGNADFSFLGKFGGSPFNVAFGLTRLEAPSAFFTRISNDMFGVALFSFLENEGVDLSHVLRGNESTTLAFVHVGEDGAPRYAFLAEGAADRTITGADLPPVLPDPISALSFGSFSLAVEPCGTAYEALMRREHRRRVIALDPNIRPPLTRDMNAHRRRIERMVKLATVVKVSTEDVETLYPGSSPLDVGKSWQNSGPALVVVTDGENGAVAFLNGCSKRYRGRKVDVVDTVGAGDTFQAAMLAEFNRRNLLRIDALERLTLAELDGVMEFAVAASALTCTRRGADIPRLREVVV
jgi:fructokinase